MLKKKQTMRANNVVLSMQNPYPYFEWNRLLRYRRIFLEKSDGTRQENVDF